MQYVDKKAVVEAVKFLGIRPGTYFRPFSESPVWIEAAVDSGIILLDESSGNAYISLGNQLLSEGDYIIRGNFSIIPEKVFESIFTPRQLRDEAHNKLVGFPKTMNADLIEKRTRKFNI